MIYSTAYSNSLNLFWILLLCGTFPFIAFSQRLIVPLFFYYLLLAFVVILYSRFYMYRIEIKDGFVCKLFLLKKKEIISIKEITQIEVSVPDVRSSPSVKIFYLKNNKTDRIWFPCLNREDLKKIVKFFKEKNIEIKVLPETKNNIFH